MSSVPSKLASVSSNQLSLSHSLSRLVGTVRPSSALLIFISRSDDFAVSARSASGRRAVIHRKTSARGMRRRQRYAPTTVTHELLSRTEIGKQSGAEDVTIQARKGTWSLAGSRRFRSLSRAVLLSSANKNGRLRGREYGGRG